MATDALSDKLRGESLRRLVQDDSVDDLPVMIELELPEPDVSVRRDELTGFSRISAVHPLDPAETLEAERRISAAEKLISQETVNPPRVLRRSGSVLARVPAKGLRNIAASPLVRAVWPNEASRT